MTRGHAGAVILLGGWLLMTPPMQGRTGKVALDQWDDVVVESWLPITEWDQVRASDTAAACEEERSRLGADADRTLRRVPSELAHRASAKLNAKERRDQGERVVASSNFLARCVPAESVYP